MIYLHTMEEYHSKHICCDFLLDSSSGYVLRNGFIFCVLLVLPSWAKLEIASMCNVPMYELLYLGKLFFLVVLVDLVVGWVDGA